MRNRARALISRLDLRATLQDYVLLTVGGVLMAANLNLFLAPSNIAPGGVSGTAIIVNKFTGWPIGLTMLVLNVPLAVLGFRHLGRFRFLIRTVYVMLLYSLGVDFLARWIPSGGITDDLLLNALYGGVVGGLGVGLVYRGGGTTAGTGILGRLLQMRTGIPVSQIYIVTDGGVILVAGLVFGWEKGLYALMTLFVWGLAADYVLEGPSVVRTAFIITDKPQAVAHAVLSNLRLGVTAWPAQGMFTKSEHTVLFCTVSRPYEGALKSVVAGVDPDAFLVIGHGHQASGGVLGRAAYDDRER
ncbi:MAG: YitT family protein [Chloroflexi bacterium]|jgi:uncharacterized membrane-anchored protein YitT (DUF2179 family)|nr:YitT family protein [Chloroflexota bacterium]